MNEIYNFITAFLFGFALATAPAALSCLIIVQLMKQLTEHDELIRSMHGKKRVY